MTMYNLARDRPRDSIKRVTRDVKRGEIAVFEGRFLGSIPVTVKEGDEVVRQAIAYLREQVPTKKKEKNKKIRKKERKEERKK